VANRAARGAEPGERDLARAHEIRELLEAPAGSVDLSAVDARATPGLPERTGERKRDPKAWSRAEVARLGAGLALNQERLFARAVAADDERRLLLIFQALDCGGKDGTIKNVVGTMNPQGVRIKAFGPPTKEELKRDFLWRIRRALPEAGRGGVFNRSHYEDVLVARVRKLVPAKTWRTRFDAINAFESDLLTSGFTVVKVMLHISYDEQRRRLLERLTDPTKRWKFNPGDLQDRRRWPEYQAAYEDALRRCSLDGARWHVVPADRKWYRNWAVTNIVLAAFDDMKLTFPEVAFDAEKLRKQLESDSDPESAEEERTVNKR
jgi:PPK2 family polyphosphate:nucleotide phosphotransferase